MHNNKSFMRYYSNAIATKQEKIVGRIRHFPPANKEWKDSAYSFNKTSLKELSSKYKLTHNLLKYHFNINNLNRIARSRRMRSLIKRRSSKRIIISKPEIKQTNDKVIINVYVFDREKQALIRNLYYYNKKYSLDMLWLFNNNKTVKKFNAITKRLDRKRKILYMGRHKKYAHYNYPYHNFRYKNEMDFFKFRSLNLYKKFLTVNNNVMLLFVSHILSLFNITILIPFKDNKINSRLKEKIKDNMQKILIVMYNKLHIIKGTEINVVFKKFENNINLNKNKLNNYLWHLLIINLVKTKFITKKQINFLYSKFENIYYKKLINKFYKKDIKTLRVFTKFELNKLKYSSLLNNVRSMITNIYNKKAELNIINLKYIHLNSDIYTQAITTKLRKKTKALKTLKRSLRLVKIPSEYFYRKEVNNLNKFNDLNIFKSLNLTNMYSYFSKNNLYYNDKLSTILLKLYPNNIIHHNNYKLNNNELVKNKQNKIIEILNTIKYKWIKGARIEIAGRLTRRNTASRAMFKFRYKGNLNDKQYYIELDHLKTMSTVMLRNSFKANRQYASDNSKKRIGAFGVKSWITSY